MSILYRAEGGWFPKVSWPYVAYGFGEVHVVDLREGKEVFTDGKAWVSGWLEASVLQILKEVPGGMEQWLWSEAGGMLNAGTDPALANGAIAADGHWASLNGGRLVYDGNEVATDSRFLGLSLAHDYLAVGFHGRTDAQPEWKQWTIRVYHMGRFSHEVVPVIPAVEWRVDMTGSVYYGDNARSFRDDAEITATDNAEFPARPNGYRVVGPNATTLLHTPYENGGYGYLFELQNGAATWDAESDVIAYADAQGRLTVERVDMNDDTIVRVPVIFGGVPPVEPTPDPEPPKPEGEPMRLTAAEKATLIAFDEKFPVAAIPVADEAARREWTWKLAQTFAARFIVGWGTKRADPNRPLSKDSIAYVSAGRLYGFDVVLGTDPLTLNENVDGEDITGQVYVPVPAYDWLADTPVPPVEPPVEPPGPAPTDLEKRVAELEAIVAKIDAFLQDTFKEFGK